ncbi:MAG TPA: tripartite tricarboxylate transporter permease [Hyphomicrobiaceae bacterium]|jgi:putative tricarboxylic transport membrane protein|nr:tripartite tricarboxylate transporter permease [Hyphomicrobiaceae bacterium]
MLDVLVLLAHGFLIVFQPINLFVLFVGLVLGLLVAVLPGLTLVMGVVLALPFTYKMGITPALILLTAMYVTGTYGGAFTSILFRIPGEPIDVPLLWDGYPMAKNGEPAKALGWTLFAALCGGLVAATMMVVASEPVARIALTFSAPEYFALVLFGLASVVCLGGGSLVNAFVSLFIGLLIASVGVDGTFGVERFSFGIDTLRDGIEYLNVMVGAYGLGEVLTRLEQGFTSPTIEKIGKIETKLPSFKEISAVKGTFARSSILGIIVGVVPGAGATIASFLSYGLEAQHGRRRREMGTGIPEGIVAPQAAATASVGGAMIPLLTMGIPGSGATAIILAAFMLQGIQPGPQVFVSQPLLIYSIFASIFVSLVAMSLLGYFAIKALVKVLELKEAAVSAFVVMFCFIGALAARNNVNDLWTIVAFGGLGYLFEKFQFPIAPMVLGTILGPLAENYFLTAMISAQNDWTVFFTRPVSLVLVLLSAGTIVYQIYRSWRESGLRHRT